LTLADEYTWDCGGHATQVRIGGREEDPASRARLLSPNSHDAERLGASARHKFVWNSEEMVIAMFAIAVTMVIWLYAWQLGFAPN
jgi:hypothetical protein